LGIIIAIDELVVLVARLTSQVQGALGRLRERTQPRTIVQAIAQCFARIDLIVMCTGCIEIGASAYEWLVLLYIPLLLLSYLASFPRRHTVQPDMSVHAVHLSHILKKFSTGVFTVV
jgi:hypothetical protein